MFCAITSPGEKSEYRIQSEENVLIFWYSENRTPGGGIRAIIKFLFKG